jgi:hypothetical protein
MVIMTNNMGIHFSVKNEWRVPTGTAAFPPASAGQTMK